MLTTMPFEIKLLAVLLNFVRRLGTMQNLIRSRKILPDKLYF